MSNYLTSTHKMLNRLSVLVLSLLTVGLMACGAQESQQVEDASSAAKEETTAHNKLSQAEKEAGWSLLFDGENLSANWIGLGRDQIPEGHWTVENGAIRKVSSGDVPSAADGQPLEGGDIMTKETFQDYEFSFDWKVSEAGNSGVKYNVSEEMSTANEPIHAALGFEYQVLDDEKHPDSEDVTHRSGALYDMIPANDNKQLKPVGQWNHSRIVFDGSHGEHWLNGEKVVEYDLDSERFDSLLKASKYADVPGFADRRKGHIVLQDHKDDVWYRNLKIRRLN